MSTFSLVHDTCGIQPTMIADI